MSEIFVVQGSSGEYSGIVTWFVCAFRTEEQAKCHVVMLEENLLRLRLSTLNYEAKDHPSIVNTWDEGGEEAQEEMKKIDPNFYNDYSGARYWYESIELRG